MIKDRLGPSLEIPIVLGILASALTGCATHFPVGSSVYLSDGYLKDGKAKLEQTLGVETPSCYVNVKTPVIVLGEENILPAAGGGTALEVQGPDALNSNLTCEGFITSNNASNSPPK